MKTNGKINGGISSIKGKTFRQVAEEYLANAKGTIASTTYDRYLDALERDVYPEYADTPMADVTDIEMNRFLKVAVDTAAKRGRTLTNSTLMVIKSVMSNVIDFANASEGHEKADLVWERTSYEELTTQELVILCQKAKNNHCS